MVQQQAGLMNLPTDCIGVGSENALYVVEHRNHRISKWIYQQDSFNIELNLGVVNPTVTITNGGSGYTSPPTVTFNLPTGGVAPKRAQGTATITGDAVTSITLTDLGNGYSATDPPTISFSGGGGTGAAATATLQAGWGNNQDGTTGQPNFVTGPTDNSLDHPTGIAFDGTRLVITDTNHNRIRTIDRVTGQFLGSAGVAGISDATEFNHPTGIGADPNPGGKIVVADEGNRRVISYDSGTTPSNAAIVTGPNGTNGKVFNRPHGVGFNEGTTKFLVSDTRGGVMNVFDSTTLAFDSQIGQPSADTNIDSGLFFPGTGRNNRATFANQIFANTRKNRITTYNTMNMQFSTSMTQLAGQKNGEIYWPETFTLFDGTGTHVYQIVANTRNHRIELYASNGQFGGNFGSPNPIPT